MDVGRALWPLLFEMLVAGPALLVAVVMVAGGARLSGPRRALAVAAGLALAVYELQSLVRQTGIAFVDLSTEVHFAWSVASLPLYVITVLLFVGASLADRWTVP